MRITKISVEKLFGFFDHEIRLNMDDRITIIHAPNGYGKTLILKMVNGLFNSRYSDLRNTPYKSFHVEFDNDQRLEIRQDLEPQKRSKIIPLEFTLHNRNGDQIESFKTKSAQKDMDARRIPISAFEDLIPGLTRITGGTWFYQVTGETLGTEEVIEQFSENIPGLVMESPRQGEEWLMKIKSEVNVYFIESQRLLSFTNEKNIKNYRKSSNSALLPTVTAYSDELVQEIKERLSEYASVSQSLDGSFPTRVVKRMSFNELTNDELRSKLAELEESRNRLMESGLLEKEEEQNFPIQPQDNIDEGIKNVLAVYVEDVEKKLAVFGDIASKIELFRRIINSKFSYKEIVVSREKGFIFRFKYPKSNNNSVSDFLSPSSLSSGEQHELVLLYELLFKVKENSLVLIDEPELSLHVGWQVNFLRDLQEITELAGLDMLIATHSPSLIHDRWDLTVELKGVSS